VASTASTTTATTTCRSTLTVSSLPTFCAKPPWPTNVQSSSSPVAGPLLLPPTTCGRRPLLFTNIASHSLQRTAIGSAANRTCAPHRAGHQHGGLLSPTSTPDAVEDVCPYARISRRPTLEKTTDPLSKRTGRFGIGSGEKKLFLLLCRLEKDEQVSTTVKLCGRGGA
jgi:hypothetical protein